LNDCILVTGGAGFIGSNFVLKTVGAQETSVVNLDKLTYAGNLHNLESLRGSSQHTFVQGDICDRELVRSLLNDHRPKALVHFAAESHVDRSILGPEEFIRTNISGTFTLLDESKRYWQSLTAQDSHRFRFVHVSTDEVYGSLSSTEPAFTEDTAFAPNSPYAASKASSDHLVRAYHHTYGLPTLTSNCSNNYGPYQFPEKLIPLTILNACEGRPIPVYGDGKNVRDWLYVEDHCDAISVVLKAGAPGETYNVGGSSEKTNIEVVTTICELLDELVPQSKFGPHASLIKFVKDRPGHDRRYAVDARKLCRELGWQPRETFRSGMRKTIAWYLSHRDWLASVISGDYKQWIATQYATR
jgi:dTDP-glucose 4,6-dehydratase